MEKKEKEKKKIPVLALGLFNTVPNTRHKKTEKKRKNPYRSSPLGSSTQYPTHGMKKKRKKEKNIPVLALGLFNTVPNTWHGVLHGGS